MKDELPSATVKHVVVLMLENRGFDHLMGWLYGSNEEPVILSHQGDDRPFMGLSTLSQAQLAALANPTPSGGLLPINVGARSPKTPSYNTGESFAHIMNQMWGVAEDPATWMDRTRREALIARLSALGPPPMNGYVLDYNEDVYHHTHQYLGRDALSEVLDTYTPAQVPVLSGLARYFAVSDEWYCSAPSQTNTNRAFSMTGTSRGMVNNSFYDPPSWNPSVWAFRKASGGISNADALPVSTRSLFEVMEQAGFSWKVFWQDEWPPKDTTMGMEWQYTRTMIPFLADKQFNSNFVKFDASNPQNPFFEAARSGGLPALSWIEPKWGGGAEWNSFLRAVGNDYHPVSDTTVGEDFVMSVYSALAAGPHWEDTLLIITFDENGGTYDHMLPPRASPSLNDPCPLPGPPIDHHDMDADTRTQFGFGFNQFGVRVPTLLISPRIPQGVIFRSQTEVPFDHTSMIATILNLAQIDPQAWMLGSRVANAPSFEFMLGGQARQIADPMDALKIPGVRQAGETLNYNLPYVLQYVGDPWRAQPGPTYLGPSESGRLPTYYYPTMTSDPGQAVKFKFVPSGGGDGVTPMLNMSLVRIKTTEPSLLGYVLLTVNPELSAVFYDRGGNQAGAHWQIRLLSSRDRRDEIRTGDLVYFVSQLPPAAWQNLTVRTLPDPMQRLLPLPTNPKYASTRAGEWALWKIVPAVGDDIV